MNPRELIDRGARMPVRSRRSAADRAASGAQGGTGKSEVMELRQAVEALTDTVDFLVRRFEPKEPDMSDTSHPEMIDTSATAKPGEAVFDIADRYEVQDDYPGGLSVVVEIPTGARITWPCDEGEAHEIADDHNREWRAYVMDQ
jgi:hypothetical protein